MKISKMTVLVCLMISLLIPGGAFAYDNWGVDIEYFSFYDILFDILSFSLAVVGIGLGIQILDKLTKKLRLAWGLFLSAFSAFALLQLFVLLGSFRAFDASGFFSVLKFVMAVLLFVSVVVFRSFFLKVLARKIYDKTKTLE